MFNQAEVEEVSAKAEKIVFTFGLATSLMTAQCTIGALTVTEAEEELELLHLRATAALMRLMDEYDVPKAPQIGGCYRLHVVT